MPGPPPDPVRAALRERFDYMSPRSFGTFWRALCTLYQLEQTGYISREQAAALMAAVPRSRSGRPNVAAFSRMVAALTVKRQS